MKEPLHPELSRPDAPLCNVRAPMLATLQKWNRRWNRTFRVYSHERAPNCAQAAYRNQHVSVLVRIDAHPTGDEGRTQLWDSRYSDFCSGETQSRRSTLQPLHYIRVTRRVMRQAVAAYGVCGIWHPEMDSDHRRTVLETVALPAELSGYRSSP